MVKKQADRVDGLAKKYKAQDAKQTQTANKETELFKAALNNPTYGVIVGDLYGYITDINDNILKMYGTTDKTEFIGKNILKFAVKTDVQRALNDSLNMITANQGQKSEYRAIRKNREEVPVEVTSSFIRDENGEKIGFINTIRILPFPLEKKCKRSK
jgi:PAS domain S-box-containing protein